MTNTIAKTYTIKITKKTECEVKGTLDELIEYFSHTLAIGHSWNKKIDRKPKTIKSFVKNLQMAYTAKEISCYERTFVELI